MLFLYLLVFVSIVFGQNPGSLLGQVVDGVSGVGVARVQLRLIPTNPKQAPYGAMTNETGRFSVSPIVPGLYLVTCERTGFVVDPTSANTSAPLPSVRVNPAQNVTAFQIKMLPESILSGRILDEKGLPVDRATVMVESASGLPMNIAYLRDTAQTVTNADGEFRLQLPAGNYFVKAAAIVSTPEIRPDGSTVTNYANTYFPAAPDTKSADAVTLRPGKETPNIEVRLIPRIALTISGVVSGPAATGANVFIAGPSSFIRNYFATPAGTFLFESLMPGKYSLAARSSTGASPIVEVELKASSIRDVDLRLQPLVTLSGKIKLDRAGSRITLTPMLTALASPRTDPIDADGNFEIQGLQPHRFRLAIDPAPGDQYVKTLLLDGSPASQAPMLDLRDATAASKLTIELAQGAHLSGVISNDAGPVSLGAAILVPEGATDLLSAAIPQNAGKDGKYSIAGIAPGRYRVAALGIDARMPTSEEQVRAVLQRAEIIELKANDRVVKDLSVLKVEVTKK